MAQHAHSLDLAKELHVYVCVFWMKRQLSNWVKLSQIRLASNTIQGRALEATFIDEFVTGQRPVHLNERCQQDSRQWDLLHVWCYAKQADFNWQCLVCADRCWYMESENCTFETLHIRGEGRAEILRAHLQHPRHYRKKHIQTHLYDYKQLRI